MTVGDLVVNLGMNINPLTGAIARARKSLGGMAGNVASLAGRFGPLAAGITGVAGVAGFGLMVKNSIDTISSLVDVSNKLGLTTEALGGLHHAAELSGVSSEQLDKSLVKMTQGISLAAAGSGPAVAALDELGLSAKKLESLSPDQQFAALTQAMEGVEGQGDKIRISMALFGKTGSDVLNIMSGGVEGLNAALEDAHALGLAPSSSDAARVEAMGDNLDRAKKAFIGIANTVAIAVAPALDWAADLTVQFGQYLNQSLQAWLPAAERAFGSFREWVSDAFVVGKFYVVTWTLQVMQAFAQVELGVVAFAGAVGHFFTAQLPAWLGWLSKNWSGIWRTALDFTLTALINLGQNIRSIFSAIWEFIASGGTKTFDVKSLWKPLTEGFVNSMQALPEIAAREMGPLENQLRKEMETLGQAIASRDIGDELLAAQQARNKLAGGGALDTLGKGPAGFAGDDVEGRTEKKSGGGGGAKGPAALRVDSVEGLKAVLSAQLAANSPQGKLEKTAADTLTEQKKQTELLSRIASQEGVEEESFDP